MKKFFVIFFVLLAFNAYSREKDGSKLVKVTLSRFEESNGNEWLIFSIQPDKGYHTYWLNPGDAGTPTKFELDSLPKNISIIDTVWQIPEKLQYDEFASYGYSGKHYVIFQIKNNDGTKDNFMLRVKVSWLVCKEICIPGFKKIQVNYKKIPKLSFREFSSIQKLLPLKTPILKTQAIKNGNTIDLHFEATNMINTFLKDFTFIPYENGYLNNGVKQEIKTNVNNITLSMTMDNLRNIEPKLLNGILISSKPIIKGMPNKSIEIKSEIFQNK